ncbi:hypothetical protein [Nocardia sp. NRRL S-836]|uniref:hypothetical protein n=1 Tax=Nocardia sp. NRRL S-836 TaxID=1519492 RepID=UPI0012FB3FC5|nr:hypothetical protein [Nocardia sp. NRRL S-836]
MPELVTMSITVTLAPRARAGLYALLRAQLGSTPSQNAANNGGGVVNMITGNVSGNAVQAGHISGDIHLGGKPHRRR